MGTVTFSAGVGGDGSTVTDDSNASTGLANGGHRTRLVPAFAQVVAVAANTVTKATEAAASAAAAAISAASAAAIAGAFVGTSTTSWTPAIESKAFTTQGDEQYTTGIWVTVVSAGTPTAWGFGQVTSYSGTTLTVDVQVISGTGAHTDWNISLAGARGAQGDPGTNGTDGADSLPVAAAGGTVDAITATFSPAITLTDKQACRVVSAGANTSTTPSFAPDGLTAHTITARGGAALVAGDIGAAGFVAVMQYNSANTRWELLNPAPSTSAGAEIITPTNTSPADAATDQTETPTLTGSTFYSNYAATHAATQVQVHTTTDFTTPQYSSGDQAGSVSFALPAGQLVVSTTYYWRMRYKNSRGTYSSWSTATSFATASAFNSYIATPTATPAAMGDAFEGGFYSGLIWNELIQSATSTTIGTGSKTFAVSAGAAYAYSGQALEVRSRANPVNKMIGTVTAANLSSVTIDVTSVGGSGTFTDWSIMSKYRVIVAPKSSGESSSKAYKNANTAAPSACGTLTEGSLATAAMVAAGDATTYPAAHFCNDLSIASYTDWYLPARDELELAWRNLKPTADANYTSADRPTGATPNYMNLGSYGDTANTHGLNNNSSPTGAAYTSGSPAQVAAGKNFRTSESEAFAYGSFYYWSASEYSTAYAWFQHWYSSYPGYQGNVTKTNAYYVRAVRRSII